MSSRSLGRLRDAALVLLAGLACFQHFAIFRTYVFEDAYITYRYADNLAAGNGFVFNPGERVLGTSTPLFTMLLALPRLAGLEVADAGGFVYALCLSLVALGGAWILRRGGHPNLAVLYALWTLWGTGRIFFYFGMETTFYVALQLAALICALERRPTAAGLLTGLVCLTRYDGVLFAGALLLLLWIERRAFPLRALTAAAAVTVPWFLFAQLYFGSVLPNTLGAKSHDVAMAEYMYESTARAVRNFFSPCWRFVGAGGLPRIAVALTVLALIGPLFAQAGGLFRRRPLLAVLLLQPLALWLGYSAIGPPLAHSWYLVPALYLLLLLCLLAWGQAVSRRRPADSRGAAAAAILSLVLVGASFLHLDEGARRELFTKVSSPLYRQRVDAYSLLARWVQDHGLTDLKVLMREPGFFAYRTHNPVVDAAGLVTPGVFFHGPKERRSELREVLAAHRPELVLLPNVSWEVEQLGGYVPVYQAMPLRTLFLERSMLAQRLSDVARDWRRRSFYYPRPGVELAHPFAFGFEPGRGHGWWSSDGLGFLGQPHGLRYEGAKAGPSVLHTQGSANRRGSVTSPPFRIDFDELAFRFGGVGGGLITAELFVGGLPVRTIDGHGLGGGNLVDVRWPVHSWHGRVGILRFVDRAAGGGYVAADLVRSVRVRDATLFDDFESGVYGERWTSGFGAAPASWERLATELGLQLILGDHTATSLFERGEQRMKSQPFTVERDRLAFTALDFGGPEVRVELRVGDGVVRRFVGSESRQPISRVWNVARFRGQQVVLAVVDEDPRPGRGIGIDDIRLYDPEALSWGDGKRIDLLEQLAIAGFDERHTRTALLRRRRIQPDYRIWDPAFDRGGQGARKNVIVAQPSDDGVPRSIRWRGVPIPSGSRFECFVGLDLEAAKSSDGVEFRLLVDGEVAYRETFGPEGGELPPWSTWSVPLDAWSGREVDLELEVDPLASRAGDLAFWGEPRLARR